MSTREVWALVHIAIPAQSTFSQEGLSEFLFNWKKKTKILRTSYINNLLALRGYIGHYAIFSNPLIQNKYAYKIPTSTFLPAIKSSSNLISKPKLFLL